MGCFRAKAWFCTGCSPLMARDALYESDYADVLRRNYPIGWRDKKINIIYLRNSISMLPSPNRQPGLNPYYDIFILNRFSVLTLNLSILSQY